VQCVCLCVCVCVCVRVCVCAFADTRAAWGVPVRFCVFTARKPTSSSEQRRAATSVKATMLAVLTCASTVTCERVRVAERDREGG